MKNILAAIMLMGATVSVDAMAPNAMQLNTTTLGIIDTAKQQFIAATRQASNSSFAWNKEAFNPCIQARDAMLTHLGILCDMFNQYISGRFVRVHDILSASQAYNRAQIAWTQALHTWKNIQQSKAERVWSVWITNKTKEQHAETIETPIQPSLLEAIFTSIGNSISANPIYRALQNLPNATTASYGTTIKGKCDEILGKLTLIDQQNRSIQQIENDLLTRLRQHVAGATLQDLELALSPYPQVPTITQQAIRDLDRYEKRRLAMRLNGGLGSARLAKSGIQSAALRLIAGLHLIPTQNDALRDQVCDQLEQLVNAL